ncbi:MAG TPA: hypothetical protein VKZ84_00225 [Bacteriovoracaceae bacterium]|nr:hypothetical protein [Bacteriovoracaceae bacterium]
MDHIPPFIPLISRVHSGLVSAVKVGMRFYLFFFLFFSSTAWGIVHHKVDSLGYSAKGQYIALEEYGYRPDKKAYFVEIKILNLWKKKFVGDVIRVESPAYSDKHLKESRMRAKKLAEGQLKAFGISG